MYFQPGENALAASMGKHIIQTGLTATPTRESVSRTSEMYA